MDDLMLPLPGLSPVGGKLVVARFDGGCLSSDAGVLVLREIEQRLGVGCHRTWREKCAGQAAHSARRALGLPERLGRLKDASLKVRRLR